MVTLRDDDISKKSVFLHNAQWVNVDTNVNISRAIVERNYFESVFDSYDSIELDFHIYQFCLLSNKTQVEITCY